MNDALPFLHTSWLGILLFLVAPGLVVGLGELQQMRVALRALHLAYTLKRTVLALHEHLSCM